MQTRTQHLANGPAALQDGPRAGFILGNAVTKKNALSNWLLSTYPRQLADLLASSAQRKKSVMQSHRSETPVSCLEFWRAASENVAEPGAVIDVIKVCVRDLRLKTWRNASALPAGVIPAFPAATALEGGSYINDSFQECILLADNNGSARGDAYNLSVQHEYRSIRTCVSAFIVSVIDGWRWKLLTARVAQ